MKKTVAIDTEFIKLDTLLKLGGAVMTGGEAKVVIQRGDVMVNREVCLARGKKMKPGDCAQIGETELEVTKAC